MRRVVTCGMRPWRRNDCGDGARSRGASGTADGRVDDARAVALEPDADQNVPGRDLEPHLVGASHVIEGRDVEALLHGSAGGLVGREQVRVALAVGVMDLDKRRAKCVVRADDPEGGEGVERVSEHARVGEHQHSVRCVHLDAPASEEPLPRRRGCRPRASPGPGGPSRRTSRSSAGRAGVAAGRRRPRASGSGGT